MATPFTLTLNTGKRNARTVVRQASTTHIASLTADNGQSRVMIDIRPNGQLAIMVTSRENGIGPVIVMEGVF